MLGALPKIATPMAPTSYWYTGTDHMAKRVSQLSGGEMELIQYKGTIGGEKEIYDAVKLGTLNAGLCTTGVIPQYDKVLGVLNLPYLFKDMDHGIKIIDGPFGKAMSDRLLRSGGLRVLGWWSTGYREIYNNVRPIKHVNDLKGLKIRVMQAPEIVDLYKAYGATPIAMAWGEVYSSLQQKVIDGVESALGAGYDQKHYEVVKYASRNKEIVSLLLLFVNEKWWNTLPEDMKKVFEQAEKEGRDIERQADKENDNNIPKLYAEKGVQVVFPDIASFKAVADTLYPTYEKVYGKENIKACRDVGEGGK